MCIIIHKPEAGKLDEFIIQNSLRINPDGVGFVDLETGDVWKMDDREPALESLRSPQPFIAHCRYATVGGVSFDNIHPFRFDGGWLFQNGTVGGFKDDRTDAENLADLIPKLKRSQVRSFLESFESRFLIYWDSGNVSRYGKWIHRNGVWYSKSNVLNRQTEIRPKLISGNRRQTYLNPTGGYRTAWS
jgi:predicted glutamine amidotransferase